MTKTLRLLGLAALLTTGVATATMAANDGASGSQEVTGTMTGSQQVGTPATDNTVTTRNGQHTTGTPPAMNVDPRKGSTGAGISAQSTGPQYPAVVGPTGSREQDATNPNRSSPTGGTSEGGGTAR
jgi:hypothetical protein